jgi:hypothetical protein
MVFNPDFLGEPLARPEERRPLAAWRLLVNAGEIVPAATRTAGLR